MGVFASSFVPSEEETVSVKPANPRWIVDHVKACDASIITVQRCWQRFLQLGGNKNGVLPPKAKIYSSTDKFLKQILALIPKYENNVISFQVYLNACVWFEAASPEVKSKLLFYLLNKGQSVDTALFARVLSHLYEGTSQADLEELASVTVKEIGDGNEEAFNEDNFVNYALQSNPLTAECASDQKIGLRRSSFRKPIVLWQYIFMLYKSYHSSQSSSSYRDLKLSKFTAEGSGL